MEGRFWQNLFFYKLRAIDIGAIPNRAPPNGWGVNAGLSIAGIPYDAPKQVRLRRLSLGGVPLGSSPKAVRLEGDINGSRIAHRMPMVRFHKLKRQGEILHDAY